MKLSIVATLYRSQAFIEEFYRRSVAAAETLTDTFELVLVNDGSPDDSLAGARRLHETDPRVVVVDLSRNFGHHRAMMAGLAYARGDLVFLIDSDLEEKPEYLIDFHRHMMETKSDVVFGVQEKRRGGWGERISGELFYTLLRRLGGIDIPRNLTTTRLMTRRYVHELVRHQEREIVIAALWVMTGFRQVPFPVVKAGRKQATNYGLMVKLRLAIDYATSFSSNILYYVFYAGLLVSGFSFLMLVYFVGHFMVTGQGVVGWTSVIVSIWMFGGLTILLLGLIGIYIARIFYETKQRPYVIVRELFREGMSETKPSAADDALHLKPPNDGAPLSLLRGGS